MKVIAPEAPIEGKHPASEKFFRNHHPHPQPGEVDGDDDPKFLG
jgi:hypothetical protein